MAQAAALSDWAPAPEAGYEPVPFAACCKHAAALPRGFAEAVRATRVASGGGGGGGGAAAAA